MLAVFSLYVRIYIRMFSRYYYFRSPHSQEEVLRILGNAMRPEKVPTEEREALLHRYSPREYEGEIKGDTFRMSKRPESESLRAKLIDAALKQRTTDDPESQQNRFSIGGRVVPDGRGSIVVLDGEGLQLGVVFSLLFAVVVVYVGQFEIDTASVWAQLLLLFIGGSVVCLGAVGGWMTYKEMQNIMMQLCDANEVHGKFVLPQAENV